MTEIELLERILEELIKVNLQLNPLNRPTYASDVTGTLSAIASRLEVIEEIIRKPS